MGVKEITTLGLCLLATVSSVSLPPRRWYSETVDGPEACVRLEHKCNSVFNRSATEAYTKLPNDRGLTLEASIFEFSEFDQLLQQNCSSSLWTLLCFYYFPQCNPNYSLKHVVTPCREQCVEAKRHCEPLLLRYNASWPEHLECSKFNRHSDDRLCINRAPNPALIDRVLNPPPVAPTTTSTTTVSSSSVAATTSSSIIPSPTPLPPSESLSILSYTCNLIR